MGKLKIADLVGRSFPIETGSGTTEKTWKEHDLIVEIYTVLYHNFFDFDFFYNWTNFGTEYREVCKKNILNPLVQDIEETLNKYFRFQRTPYSTLSDVLVFFNKDAKWIDSWFKSTDLISNELRQDYIKYRKEYAGVTL